MPDYRAHLAGFERPVRLVVGGHDLKFQEIADGICRWWPAADVEIVPQAGHNVPLEAPSAVAQIVSEVVVAATGGVEVGPEPGSAGER